MKRQNGSVFRFKVKGRYVGPWYGRWREDVLVDGRIKRKQRSKILAEVSDRYRTEKDVRPLLDDIVRPLNQGKVDARSTMTLTDFVEQNWLPYCEQKGLSPATLYGYKQTWRLYLKPHIGGTAIRDLEAGDVTQFLFGLRKNKVGHRTIKYAKAVGRLIFNHALAHSIIKGDNPFQNAELPIALTLNKRQPAASMNDVAAMLGTLQKKAWTEPTLEGRTAATQARAAIGLMFFTGLRPSEARAVRWEDYDEKRNRLTVQRSVWHKHHEGRPTKTKTVEPVPVIKPLRDILTEVREATGNPISGPILRGEHGQPLHLDNLARRVIRPALKAAGIIWRGYYSFRRGAGTVVTEVAKDQGLAAKGLLRHANIATTQSYYIKDVPSETQQAMNGVEEKYQTLADQPVVQ
jgi:integrase